MRRSRPLSLTALLACLTLSLASQKSFSIHDDILAFPQFEVIFPDEYVLESDARSRLAHAASSKPNGPDSSFSSPSPSPSSAVSRQHDYTDTGISHQVRLQDGKRESDGDSSDGTPLPENSVEHYEEMMLHGQRYLCEIPRVKINDTSVGRASPTDQEKEIARATDRGLELLREMEGRCMYYIAGWWSYSFCYKSQVRQFHSLPPGNGVPVYPPAEDPTTQSYVLGKFRHGDEDDEESHLSANRKSTTDVAELQTKGESRYLVQYLEDGTTCDLTGRDRKIEVQFHCHPQSTDRIGWIKEVTTCSYLMVIYTPRLCNDIAFQPPREDEAHGIACLEIITPEEVPGWEAAKAERLNERLVGAGAEPFPIVGDIQVGAMKLVGQDGRRIEKGNVASAGEEKAAVVARSDGGEVQRLSREELKRFNLDPEKIESLKKQLEELAGGKDWKLEVVDNNGERGLRGIIDNNGEEDGEEDNPADRVIMEDSRRESQEETNNKMRGREQREKQDDSDEGSDETYKEEL